MKRILQVIPSLDLAGAEKFLVHLLKQLSFNDQLKVSLFVFKPHMTPLMMQVYALKNVQVYTANARCLYSIKVLIKLYRHIKENNYNIIHSHLTAPQFFCAVISKILARKITFITTEHSTTNRRRHPFFRYLDHWMYKMFDQIICVSDAVEKSLNTWLPFTAKKTSIIQNGIDLREFNQITRTYNINNNKKFNLLCIARFVPVKNQIVLIEALSTVPDAYLYLVGDGVCRLSLQLEVSQRKLDDRVYFLGICSDISTIISKADAYVQPSLAEGFGLSAVEAMAGGLPIIINDVPGLREVVGEAGLLFNGNASELANLLNRLRKDLNLQHKLSIQSRKRANLYEISITANRYADLYNRYK